MKTKKVINLISGEGTTNFRVLEEEKKNGQLWGFSKTAAIISSNPNAKGIEKAEKAGFPSEHIYIVNPNRGDLADQLNEIFAFYNPNFFHQLDWMPFTPVKKLNDIIGLNQHLGPGGKYMYGARRVYAHQLFCQWTDQNLPIEIFCQLVDKDYDKGSIIRSELVDISLTDDSEEISKEILPFEHQVQIRGRRAMATGDTRRRKPYEYNDTPEMAKLILKAKLAARDKYPPE